MRRRSEGVWDGMAFKSSKRKEAAHCLEVVVICY